MKFAICYRGISFAENYRNETHLETYNIDFDKSIQFHIENIINPIIEKGNKVDIFFNTYDSTKLESYIERLKPVNVKLQNFNPNILKCNFGNICDLLVSSLEQIKNYELESGESYDYYILNRFDIVPFANLMNCHLEENAVSTPSLNDDCFLVYHKNIVDAAIEVYKKNRNYVITHHMVYKFIESDIKYHCMYPTPTTEVGNNGAFWRLERIMFNHDNHGIKEYNIYDVFNPNSKWYGFRYEPNKSFFDAKRLCL